MTTPVDRAGSAPTVSAMTHPSPACHCAPSAEQVVDLPAGVQGYVAGFLIDPADGSVLLVRKLRPAWQAGKLNGIGGHIEAGETPAVAMRREFAEEAGLDVADFEHFAYLSFPAGAVWFFRAFAPAAVLAGASTMTDESIECWSLTDLACGGGPALPNLSWLLPLAAYRSDRYAPIVVRALANTC